MSAWQDRRFVLGCASLVLLLLAAALPPIRLRGPIYDVVVVMDITGSMNTRDATVDGAPASRIDLEKRAARDLLAALPCGSRLGLGLFVEKRSFLLFEPVETCGNFAVLDGEISRIDWRMGWDSESHVALALRDAMERSEKAGADLIFMTDGQEDPPLWWTGAPRFADLRGRVHGLIAGLGGHEFSPIPKYDENGKQIGFWRPGEVPSERGGLFRGHEHLSAVDEPHLKSLESETGLRYLHLTAGAELLPALRQAAVAQMHDRSMSVGFLPALLALVSMGLGFVSGGQGRRPWTLWGF